MLTPHTHWIIFAHGSSDPAWLKPIQQLQNRLQASVEAPTVHCAYLELMEPDLPTVLANCLNNQCEKVIILPFFVSEGRHLRHDLPKILEEFKQQAPQIEIHVLAPIGELDGVQQAIVDICIQAAHQ